ncbi:MAG: ribonuclease J [Epsilonproteobacteria bacterium]|nr:ribonuclease J [Campylobacterota bacterium]PIP09965.1 MAG: ribonuclease J [Sulfurimonas sp. CG23_combo_of_CG06-09_8_20_14_all_36_33]PIS25204.1 MAG: ribonuclease J [Sulfurimonas sp. CG08_land_8_20_14_0_20_36_33]PIU35338.1 MAG: ribonuclease J [Sulfurimonas sp. CG07_land_8_20_14_0_80_36_56]PIV05155.1 MAG: ribonuclease J [Sulfurimonas sp. CG03_land_8_20_14_0_80_36_25]PIV36821.1 MAG: ribonuclease J [Sulfurimonas sp. CG02_land_8_20_14_3_00_36_67]PIV60841.1 MAG: ribonuclease J [Sulfurimonas sp. C
MAEENQGTQVSNPQENSKPRTNNRRPHNNNRKPNDNANAKTGEQAGGAKPNNNQNRNKSNSANSNSNNNKNRHRRQPTPIDENLKTFVAKNQEAHKQRLNPHYKLDLNSTAKIRITPLGGLGEIGGNITVIETDKEAILVDVGMSFPDEDMHGVDILIPDFTYLREIKHKIVAVIITHAHEDHIGAMPYLYKEMQFPIYGTSLPLAMIGNKFDEHHIKEHRRFFNPIQKRDIVKIGEDFEIEWMHMTHSIIDSSSLAITTKAGTLIHTGDFKIDYTPVDGYTADLHRLAHYGEKGVLCLMSDSTNSYNTTPTGSELSVGPALDRVFSKAEGRVLLSTFSSNIHRVQQAIQYGIKYGRKVCVIGRSMERNLELAMQYDYVKFPKNIFVDADEVARLNDKEVLIVTTGSQGEPNSALFRMSIGEHRHIKIKPTDLIILSSRAIPGNEGSISGMLNHLQRAGANVARDRDIHVSGHASMEEQKLMLRLVNPKFFLPIHGEYNHVMKHKETAIMCGVPERNILLMTDGEQIEVSPKYMRKVKTVKTGKTYIDNQNNHQIEDDIILDRQKLASDGIVVIVAQVDRKETKMLEKPHVTTFGLVADKQDKAFALEMEDVLEHFLLHLKSGLIENSRALENDLRQIVRKHIYRKMKRYPLIVPHVLVS